MWCFVGIINVGIVVGLEIKVVIGMNKLDS